MCRFLASIDILAAIVQRHDKFDDWNIGTELIPGNWMGGMEQALLHQFIAVNNTEEPHADMLVKLQSYWRDQIKRKTLDPDVCHPLLWHWVFGGGGCLHISEGANEPYLTPCEALESNKYATSLEVDLCGFHFNHKKRMLHNLPGEFMLQHQGGLSVKQWEQLLKKERRPSDNRLCITVGPTNTGKFDDYFLISWINSDQRLWEWNWQENHYHVHDSNSYSRVESDLTTGSPPLLTRWKKAS